MPTILSLLKVNQNARLSLGRAWMVWDEGGKEWQIYHQPYGRRQYLYNRTTSQEKAVQYLLAATDGEANP